MPTVSPSRPPRARFSATRAQFWIESLVEIGPREASSRSYRTAADLVGARFRELGYKVGTQSFRVRAGYMRQPNRNAPVPEGTSLNVIAKPAGFDERRAFVVVGGHLDTTPDSPGANDNASGVAVMLELARMASVQRPATQVVFVAFGAEERRRQTESRSQYAAGARAYVASLSGRARANLRTAIILDMVGAGRDVQLLGTPSVRDLALRRARAIGVPARVRSTFYYSDHLAFIEKGLPALWLWAGDHKTLHTAFDLPVVIQPEELARVGKLAWELLRRPPGHQP